MAGYKDAEISQVVSKYVKSKLTISTSPLGPTDAGSKFNEVIELFSSTLVYDPNSIFYLIYLASNRLNVDVKALLEYVDDIIVAIGEMTKVTKDVTNTTPLGDAATALLSVDQILTSNGAISSKAFSSYKTSVTKFIDDSLKQNVKSGSNIVRPPQLARTEAKTDLSALSAGYKTLLTNVDLLVGMLDEFNGLNLPVLMIQGSVQNIRSDLQDLQSYFESSSQTRDDRISKCREAYLQLASGKAILDSYLTVTDPSDPRLSSSSTVVGRVAIPAGTLGELIPAEVSCTKSAPWPIVTGTNDELKISEDGNGSTTYTLTAPSQPSLLSTLPDTYDIVASTNDCLEIDELGPPVILTAGTGRTAAQIVSDITSWITTNYPGEYSAAVVVSGGKNYVQITKSQSGIQRLTMTAENSTYYSRIVAAYTTLGFYRGESDDNTGVTASEVAAQINAVGKVTATVEQTAYEEGTTGIAYNATTFDLPLNTLASLSHANDQLLVRTGKNAGYHRIVSIARTTIDRITLSSSTPLLDFASNQSWIIVRELLTIQSTASDLTSEIIIGAGNSNTTLGFTAGTTEATTTGFRAASSNTDLDFSKYDVVVGDILYTKTTGGETKRSVLELSDSSTQLEVDPPFKVSESLTGFRILSVAAVDYEVFKGELDAWVITKDQSDFASNTLELDRVMNPLLVNQRPSLAMVADASLVALDLRTLLDDLSTLLVAFTVASVSRMDAALKMLKERSMDRAYDLLMRGKVADFFSMDKDDAASSAFMLKSMRAVAQKDLPTSKLEDDADDTRLTVSSTGTDANQDYSDQDQDENLRILGEVPDYDDAGDEAVTSRARY